MALVSRLYFNAVFGALGGLLGWMLSGVFGQRNPSSETALLFLSYEDLNLLLGGAIIGGVIGYFVVSVEALRDLSLVRFARLASYGVLLGAVVAAAATARRQTGGQRSNDREAELFLDLHDGSLLSLSSSRRGSACAGTGTSRRNPPR